MELGHYSSSKTCILLRNLDVRDSWRWSDVSDADYRYDIRLATCYLWLIACDLHHLCSSAVGVQVVLFHCSTHWVIQQPYHLFDPLTGSDGMNMINSLISTCQESWLDAGCVTNVLKRDIGHPQSPSITFLGPY